MNDFTKDELQQLYALSLVHENKCISPLRTKIQSMIDNYCEHDCKDTIFIRTVTACSKCDYPVGAYRK